jgi:FkbM family methyltransferase
MAWMPVRDQRAHIQAHWAAGVFYERALMQEIWARHGQSDLRRIYDVGACVGNHTVWFALAFPIAVVYAFEPNAPVMDVAAEAVKANGVAPRVLLCPYALSDEVRRGHMVETGNEGMARLEDGDDFGVYPLDALSFRAPDLIKIDAEGSEEAILRGAAHTLEVYHPALYIEGDLERLSEILTPYGYRHTWTGCRTPTHGFRWG